MFHQPTGSQDSWLRVLGSQARPLTIFFFGIGKGEINGSREFPGLCNVQTGAESFMLLAQEHLPPRWRGSEEKPSSLQFLSWGRIAVSFCILIKTSVKKQPIWNFKCFIFLVIRLVWAVRIWPFHRSVVWLTDYFSLKLPPIFLPVFFSQGEVIKGDLHVCSSFLSVVQVRRVPLSCWSWGIHHLGWTYKASRPFLAVHCSPVCQMRRKYARLQFRHEN